MATARGAPKGSFLIQVLNDQNSTWQGTLSWIDKNRTLPFRSTLELIKLIDGALAGSSQETEPDGKEPGNIA